jgi:hypothetical protein
MGVSVRRPSITASTLAGPLLKARPWHQIHQHIGVAAIDSDLVTVDAGCPIAGQEQDGSCTVIVDRSDPAK